MRATASVAAPGRPAPVMSGALRRTVAVVVIGADRAAAASTALGINSQPGASVGTALLSVVLGSAGTDLAGFRLAYAVATALLALAVLPALRLPARRRD
ncbi:hypothetical protein ACFZCP_24840 [Streptomyces sp. NPDC007971]|uniref:hypothetical protein n=1 Tax=Streptomyces sp. NPDC007971 TaxID=3364799 RepID=UPI0036E306DB